LTEFEIEPIPGLPEVPPEGEEILWQGAPRWRSLALRAFHVRKVALYFGLLIVWYVASDLADGHPMGVALHAALWLALLTLFAVGVLTLLAWSMARATVYTITSRRVVMRFGVALPMTINLPFSQVASAAAKRHKDGTGDIPLTLTGGRRVSYLVLWPHVRPWHFVPAQPMLRAVEDGEAVAGILAGALSKAAEPRKTEDSARGTEPVARVEHEDRADGGGDALPSALGASGGD
jgi:hypothetical protein